MVSLPEEQWRAIRGFEGRYEVSDQGRVRSLDRIVEVFRYGKIHAKKYRGRVLKQVPNHRGYCTVQLGVNPGHNNWRVHHLVMAAFVGPMPDGLQVNHKNGIKTDNCPSNLEYVTCAENIRHARAKGLALTPNWTGENNPDAVLTEHLVRIIRQTPADVSTAELSRRIGKNGTTVWAARVGKTWKHVV